jgi:hypothetical protein
MKKFLDTIIIGMDNTNFFIRLCLICLYYYIYMDLSFLIFNPNSIMLNPFILICSGLITLLVPYLSILYFIGLNIRKDRLRDQIEKENLK